MFDGVRPLCAGTQFDGRVVPVGDDVVVLEVVVVLDVVVVGDVVVGALVVVVGVVVVGGPFCPPRACGRSALGFSTRIAVQRACGPLTCPQTCAVSIVGGGPCAET